MADIFISYSQADRPWVEKLARLIEGEGFSVWWDVKVLPGDEFGNLVLTEINIAKCVLVVWSQHSVNSDWVYGEADEARRAKKLVPVLKDAVSLPTAFRKVHAADLSQWDYQRQSPEFAILLDAIRGRAGHALEAAGAATPAYPQTQTPPGTVPPGYAPQGYRPPGAGYAQSVPPAPFMTTLNGLFDRVAQLNTMTLRLIAVCAILLMATKYVSWLSEYYASLTFWSVYWMLSEWAYAGIFAALAFSSRPIVPQLIRAFLWVGAVTSVMQIAWVFISVDHPTPMLGLYCLAYIANGGLFGAIAFTGTSAVAEKLRPFALLAIVYYAALDLSNSSITNGAGAVVLLFGTVILHVLEVIVVCLAPRQFAGKR
jgi:hypothetical protein